MEFSTDAFVIFFCPSWLEKTSRQVDSPAPSLHRHTDAIVSEERTGRTVTLDLVIPLHDDTEFVFL